MNNRTYPSSFDTRAKVVTAFIAAVLLFVTTSATRDGGSILVRYLPSLFVFTLLLAMYALSLRHVEVRERELHLVRRIGRRVIPLASISRARALVPGELDGSLRFFGNGGLFGWIGIFANATIGRYDMLSTRSDRLVILSMRDRRPFVFSVDEPQAVLTALGAKGVPIEEL